MQSRGLVGGWPMPQQRVPGLQRDEVVSWLARLEIALKTKGDMKELFTDDAIWRDMVALTWNIVTLEGIDKIEAMVDSQVSGAEPTRWQIDGDVYTGERGTESWLTFHTSVGKCKAHVKLQDGKARSLLTCMHKIKSNEPRMGSLRLKGARHGSVPGRTYWQDQETPNDAYVAIVGGGQGGMALGARLQNSGVPYVILDAHPKPGDSWRTRYPSLNLHDPVWCDHMPYIPFPATWPVFTPRDKMADWLEMYARVMDLNYWSSTRVMKASQVNDQWSVEVDRNGEKMTLTPDHIVFATGMSGYPNIPKFEGASDFKGVQFHSSKYQGGAPYKGKRAVVIGSNTSAHDICQDLWEQGCEVTMIQRSSTMVVSTDSALNCAWKPLYSQEALARGITHEFADWIYTTAPYSQQWSKWQKVTEMMRANDKELHDRLEARGFLLNFGPDEGGMFAKSACEGGGFYIDVGASDLIADGKIGLRSGKGISKIVPEGVALDSGEVLPCDVIIYATGYGSMNNFVADVVSSEVADAVGKCWGLGAGTRKDPGPWEGELRNMWKPTAVDGIWFMGGNLQQARHYSRFLALQLQARWLGESTPVYARAPVYHKR